MDTLREFSRAGPCITLGTILDNTPNWWTYQDRRFNGAKRKSKRSVAAQSGLLHDEPCRSCRDHPQTQYPDGYMD